MGTSLSKAIPAQRVSGARRWAGQRGPGHRNSRHGPQGSSLLRDPLTGQISLPGAATLQFDMVVVLPNSNARIYGGLTVKIDPTVITSPPLSLDSGCLPCGSATFQGVSNAGILGLGHIGKISPSPTSLQQWVEALTGEGKPRDAPRLPTMARRELLVSGAGPDTKSGSPAFSRTWTGVIAGGRIQPETICADTRIGAPGSFGGRETSVVGAATHGGILAFDIARTPCAGHRKLFRD